MATKRISLALCVLMSLSGCSYFNKTTVECGSEESKQLVLDIFQKEISKKSLAELKQLLSEGTTGLDVTKVKALTQQINLNLADVRTTHNDPQSNKKLCVAVLNAKLSPSMIKDANDSRAIVGEHVLQDFAISSDVPFENDKLSYEVEYSVQPTDDGKKVYAEVNNTDLGISFLNQVILDILLKPSRQNQQFQQEQEAQQQAQAEAEAAAEAAQAEADAAAQQAAATAQYQQDQTAYQQVQVEEAQIRINKSNEKLNLVWAALSKDARQQLLAEQRAWLKKRELGCRLSSVDSSNKEQARLDCESKVTDQRTLELQRALENSI